MNICIGIISYLPDNSDVRQKRLEKLNNLIKKCDEIFKLPIIIISQNWGDVELIRPINSKIILYKFKEPLGITGARKTLREKFINSEFDYLIMLDDDSELKGSPESAEKYLSQIESHPNMYGAFKSMLLKLFAISKEVFKLIDYPDLDPVRGEIFEDMYLIMALNKKYPNKKFNFSRTGDLDERSNSSSDPLSTWYHKQYTKSNMGNRTRAMIKEL